MMINLFLFILIVLALSALELKNLVNSVIVLGAFSLILSLVLYYLHAPDVAITEAAIGSGFATVIFIIAIKKRGTLIMLTYPHSRFFFYDHQGKPSGLDYDILLLFAQKLDVELEVIEVKNWQNLIPELISGRGDIIGAGMTRLKEREKQVNFSDGYFPTKVVIITNKNNPDLKSMNDLKGKTIFSVPNTSYFYTLKDIDGINIDAGIDDPNQLIKLVAEDTVKIAAIDLIEALDAQMVYPDLRILGPISDIQEYGYGVAKTNRKLLMQLKQFLKDIKQDGTYQSLYKKYMH